MSLHAFACGKRNRSGLQNVRRVIDINLMGYVQRHVRPSAASASRAGCARVSSPSVAPFARRIRLASTSHSGRQDRRLATSGGQCLAGRTLDGRMCKRRACEGALATLRPRA